jgi:cytoskeletal protein CcmA (bactofilin family)
MEEIKMGFFQDLKQDLSQTVNDMEGENQLDDISLDANGETLGNDGLDIDVAAMLDTLDDIKSDDTVEEKTESEFETNWNQTEDVSEVSPSEIKTDLDNIEVADGIENEINEQNINTEGDNEMEELLKEVELNVEEPGLIDEPVAEVKVEDTQRTISSDTAVITEGMTINGDITSSGNMDLIGTVTGNIDILGKLNVTGTVTGNSSAAEIYAESAQINGEVRSKGSVKIGQSSVIIGDIFATSAVIAGAVKGDIDVHGPVILDTSAIVMGNIKSKSVQINNGAVIEGMCSQCYADVSPSTFFNDVKKNRNKGN